MFSSNNTATPTPSSPNRHIVKLNKDIAFLALATLEASTCREEFELALKYMTSSISQSINGFLGSASFSSTGRDDCTEFVTRLNGTIKIVKNFGVNVNTTNDISKLLYKYLDRIYSEIPSGSFSSQVIINTLLSQPTLLSERALRILQVKGFKDIAPLLQFVETRSVLGELTCFLVLQKIEQLPFDETKNIDLNKKRLTWGQREEENFLPRRSDDDLLKLIDGSLDETTRQRFLDIMFLRFLSPSWSCAMIDRFVEMINQPLYPWIQTLGNVPSYVSIYCEKLAFFIDKVVTVNESNFFEDNDDSNVRYRNALSHLLSIIHQFAKDPFTSSTHATIISDSVWFTIVSAFSRQSTRIKLPVPPPRTSLLRGVLSSFKPGDVVALIKTTAQSSYWPFMMTLLEESESDEDFRFVLSMITELSPVFSRCGGRTPEAEEERQHHFSAAFSRLIQLFNINRRRGDDFFSDLINNHQHLCVQLLRPVIMRYNADHDFDRLFQEHEGKLRRNNNDDDETTIQIKSDLNLIKEMVQVVIRRVHPNEEQTQEEGALFQYNLIKRPHETDRQITKKFRVASITTSSVHFGRDKQDYTPEMYHWDCLRSDDGDDTTMAEVCGEKLITLASKKNK